MQGGREKRRSTGEEPLRNYILRVILGELFIHISVFLNSKDMVENI